MDKKKLYTKSERMNRIIVKERKKNEIQIKKTHEEFQRSTYIYRRIHVTRSLSLFLSLFFVCNTDYVEANTKIYTHTKKTDDDKKRREKK